MAKEIDRLKQQWLLDELAELREQGVVDEAAAQKIREYYATARERPAERAQKSEERPRVRQAKQQYALYALVLLGALMVGSGVILLFAYNWDMLSVYQRVAAAFIPVITGASCGVYTLVREKDGRWREFSAFFTAVGFAVLTALISQIYHTGGTLVEFTQLVLAVSLPLIYIFRSYLLTVAYCFSIFVLLDYPPGAYHGLAYCLAVAPFILYYLFFRKRHDLLTVWMRYICLIPIIYLLFDFMRYSEMGMELFATAALLYTAGLFYDETGISGWKNPWLVCGWLMLTVLLALGSTSPGFSYNRYYDGDMSLFFSMGTRWLVPFLPGVYVVARKPTPFKAAVMLTTLLPLLWHFMGNRPDLAMWVTNGIFLLIGAAALAEGAHERRIIKINAGMLQIALLAVIRFYDSRMGILTRAMAFIAVGTAFIAANIYISRRFRGEKTLPVVRDEVNGNVEKKNSSVSFPACCRGGSLLSRFKDNTF